MKTAKYFLLIALIAALAACNPDNTDQEPVNYETGWFPDTPENITDLNTKYDDYNSNINVIGQSIDLYYSTNKDSKGGNFDISGRVIGALVDLDKDAFSFYVSNTEPNYAIALFPKINTTSDEYGPFAFYSDSLHNSYTWWYFMYAGNKNGHFDIQFAYTSLGDWGHYDSKRQITGPLKANVLNSSRDDFYPTLSSDFTKMYFSSNRGGNFDIYEIEMDFEHFADWLQNGKNAPQKTVSFQVLTTTSVRISRETSWYLPPIADMVLEDMICGIPFLMVVNGEHRSTSGHGSIRNMMNTGLPLNISGNQKTT